MREFSKLVIILFLLLVFPGCSAAPRAFDFGTYSEAERHYEKGEYEKAIAKYEEYLREDPEGNLAVISTYYLAASHEGLGRAEEARRLYEKIIRGHPKLVWADFAKARLEELDSKARSPAPGTS